MARKKRTKKQYTELFDYPQTLFPSVETTLWPNGEPEIWFKDKHGAGFRIHVASGAAGMGITISRMTGTPGLSLSGNQDDNEWSCYSGPDMREVSLTQYKSDADSQAFKRWYQSTLVAIGPHSTSSRYAGIETSKP